MGKTITINSRLKWPDVKDDYVMMVGGHTIGRIRHDAIAWDWYIAIPMAVPDWARGTAGSLEDSQRALVSAWLRLLKEYSADRIERALEFGRAAEARLHPQTAAGKIEPEPTADKVEPQLTIKKIEPPTTVNKKIGPQIPAKRVVPTPLPPAPAEVFDTERKVAASKLLPQISVRSPDMFYFPPAEEKL